MIKQHPNPKFHKPNQRGFITPALITMIVVMAIIIVAVFEVIQTNLYIVGDNIQDQKAFNIAEAGANYYLWHLSHNPADYKDGGTTPATPNPTLGYGPYVHNYIDSNNVTEGTYTLWINPAGNGSTVTTVTSIGQVTGSPAKRTVQVQIGAPSFASYAVVSNSALWFGTNESADGPVESNQGVRMDGPNDSDVSSANSTYVPSYANGGCNSSNCSEAGVWGCTTDSAPPGCTSIAQKSDWDFPEPSIDFTQVSSALCTIKKAAFASVASTASLATQANACSQTPNTRTAAYLPQTSVSGSYSATKGYLIQLNTNGTYNLSQVNAENDTLSPYTSALTTTLLATNIAIPSTGVIFAEDNVWVRSNPTYHGRVTIAAGRLASSTNKAEIVVADNLLYSTKNGSDAIGLVSQDSIYMAPYAPPASGSFNYEIDGALLAESGNVTYGENSESTNYPVGYRSNQTRYTRGWTSSNQTLTFYGSIATNQLWTWNWELGGGPSCPSDSAYDSVNGCVSGIEHTTTSYDYNLEYNPPPDYPITSTYNILSWREVLTHP